MYVYEANTHREESWGQNSGLPACLVPDGRREVSLESGNLIIGTGSLPSKYTCLGVIKETTLAGQTEELEFIHTALPRKTVTIGKKGSLARLFSHDLNLQLVGSSATIKAEIGGRRREIPPGTSWGVVCARESGSILIFEEGTPECERVMEEARKGSTPVSRLVVYNHGAWEPAKVRRPSP